MKQEGHFEQIHRKRGNIIKNAHVEDQLPKEYDEALQLLEAYLHQEQKRNTIERRFILEVLYRLNTPVDADTLHELVCKLKGTVSLTTVYHTIDLLVSLRLAKRIDLLSNGMSFYEKTLGMEPHGYVICQKCGGISLLYRPDLLNALRLTLPRGFQPEDYTLHVHGLCSKCKRIRRRRKEADQ